jgi:hypothetical protein
MPIDGCEASARLTWIKGSSRPTSILDQVNADPASTGGQIMAMNPVPSTGAAQEGIERRKEQEMDSYFDFLHKAIASIPTGGTPFGENLKSYSEKNIATARDYMHKLSHAKNFGEVLRIQVDFAHAQFNAFSGQAMDLSEASAKATPGERDTRFKKVA